VINPVCLILYYALGFSLAHARTTSIKRKTSRHAECFAANGNGFLPVINSARSHQHQSTGTIFDEILATRKTNISSATSPRDTMFLFFSWNQIISKPIAKTEASHWRRLIETFTRDNKKTKRQIEKTCTETSEDRTLTFEGAEGKLASDIRILMNSDFRSNIQRLDNARAPSFSL